MMTKFPRWFALTPLLLSSLMGPSVHAEAVDLRSLTQSHVMEIAAGRQVLGVDVVGGGELRIAVLSGAELGLAVKLPNGTRITPENAGQYRASFRRVTPDVEHEVLEFPKGASMFTLAEAAGGRYELEVESAAGLGATLVRIDGANAGIRSGLSIADKRFVIPAGQKIPVTFALTEGDRALLGAAVRGEVRGADGKAVAAVTFNDGGVAPDPRADDGFYSGYLQSDASGNYFLTVDVTGHAGNGRAFLGREATRVVVSAPDVQLTRGFQDEGVDGDGDGFFERVAIRFEETGTRGAGNYDLTVYLRAGNGKQIDATSRVSDPALPLSVDFPADILKRLETDGPWEIVNVVLWHDGTPLGRWERLGLTQGYRLGQLERRNTLITGLVSDAGRDVDGDGLFDQLDVTIAVDALLAGNYGISADLRAPDGTPVDDAGLPRLALNSGENAIQLSFSGQKIGEIGLNGRYTVSNVLVYPLFNGDASTLAESVGQTRDYRCREFTGCQMDPLAMLEKLISQTQALELNKGLKNSLLAKLRAASGDLERQKTNANQAAANKLMAFVNEAGAQRDKSITVADADLLVDAAMQLIHALEG